MKVKGVTFLLRERRSRRLSLLPDPDLLPFSIKGEMIEEIKSELLSYHYRERGS